MIRSIFNVPHIFALKTLFFEKSEIKWNQADRHTMRFLNSNHPLLNGIQQTGSLMEIGRFTYSDCTLNGFWELFFNLIFLEK